MRKRLARTGAPAWASTRLTPRVRKQVLLPDMFDPLTTMTRSSPPRRTSLRTRRSSGISGCRCLRLRAMAGIGEFGKRIGGVFEGMAGERAEGFDFATAASQRRTAGRIRGANSPPRMPGAWSTARWLGDAHQEVVARIQVLDDPGELCHAPRGRLRHVQGLAQGGQEGRAETLALEANQRRGEQLSVRAPRPPRPRPRVPPLVEAVEERPVHESETRKKSRSRKDAAGGIGRNPGGPPRMRARPRRRATRGGQSPRAGLRQPQGQQGGASPQAARAIGSTPERASSARMANSSRRSSAGAVPRRPLGARAR